MADSGDPALDVLFLPLQQGLLPWPAGQALFLRARSGAALGAWRNRDLRCQQSFKPWAAALQRDGFDVADQAGGEFDLVLLLPTRQREAARASLAEGLQRLSPRGVLLVCAHNNEGARSIESDLRQLAGTVHSLSKQHCRVMWVARESAQIDAARLDEWTQADAPRAILEGRYRSRPGLFAWDRVDVASALLADALPGDLAGAAADFGAAWGYLSDALLSRCPGIASLDLFEAEARALPLAQANLEMHAARVRLGFHWHDVAAGVPGAFDVIVSNPPFHVDRADRPELGQAFIRSASQALRQGGRLLLVANRHLPYEAVLREGFARCQVLREAQGFKVIEAIR
ncbi:MAG TPA: methyltransferase [Arenimonas sp.]|nr:methyltransferase [Arenimonas sp.]